MANLRVAWPTKGRTFEDPEGYRVVIQIEEPPFRSWPDKHEDGAMAL